MLGIKQSKNTPVSKPPPFITALAKLTGRAEQDRQIREAREAGVSLGVYLDEGKSLSKESIDFADRWETPAPDTSQDVETESGFRRGGKTYVEVP